MILLELPSIDGSSFAYSVETKQTCNFRDVTKIIIPDLKASEESNLLIKKLNYFQRKLNLEIDEQLLTPEKITFSLKGAKNLIFKFTYNKKCELQKALLFDKQEYNIGEIDIEYINILKSPVIEKIVFKNGNGENLDLLLYPWALRGQMSSYEFSLGPALNVHSNIRHKNNKRFEKNDPVIEPIPGFFFRYGPFFLNKNGLGSLVFHYDELNLVVMGVLEGEPYTSPGLEDRKRGVFLGNIVKYKLVEFTYYNDFFRNRGYQLKLNLAPEYYFKINWRMSPQTYLQFWDKKYVNYYFGVKPEERLSGLPLYETRRTMNYGGKIEFVHFVGKFSYLMNFEVKFYGKEVYNSPTVTRKNELRFVGSVLYKIF